jgi:hypothetical protein
MKRLLILFTLVASFGATNVFSQRIIWEKTYRRDMGQSSVDNVVYIDKLAADSNYLFFANSAKPINNSSNIYRLILEK